MTISITPPLLAPPLLSHEAATVFGAGVAGCPALAWEGSRWLLQILPPPLLDVPGLPRGSCALGKRKKEKEDRSGHVRKKRNSLRRIEVPAGQRQLLVAQGVSTMILGPTLPHGKTSFRLLVRAAIEVARCTLLDLNPIKLALASALLQALLRRAAARTVEGRGPSSGGPGRVRQRLPTRRIPRDTKGENARIDPSRATRSSRTGPKRTRSKSVRASRRCLPAALLAGLGLRLSNQRKFGPDLLSGWDLPDCCGEVYPPASRVRQATGKLPRISASPRPGFPSRSPTVNVSAVKALR